MADIVEIPLDNTNIIENNQNITDNIENITEYNQNITENNTNITEDNTNITENNAQIIEDIEEIPLEKVKPIKARAKGRPIGAPNKGPSKPRAKKVQIQEVPMQDNAYEPSSPKRNLKLPTDSSSSDVAAAMLKLLQNQSYSRQSRKQRLYNSWFQ